MVVANFSHPLTDDQLAELTAALGAPVEVRAAPVHLVGTESTEAQIRTAVDAVGLSPDEWQSVPVVVVLPGLVRAAAVLLAELHGRRGHCRAGCRFGCPPRLSMREADRAAPAGALA